MSGRRLLGLAAATLLLAGFTREEIGKPLVCEAWGVRAPHFSVNASGSSHLSGQDQFTAISQAFAEWSTPLCTDLKAVDDGLTPRFDITYNPDAGSADPNVNVVVFRPVLCSQVVPDAGDGGACAASSTCDDGYDCLDDGDQDAIAVTTVFANANTGAILGAGTELNDAKFVFTTVNGPVCNQGCAGTPPDAGCGPLPPTLTALNWPCIQYDLQEVVTIEAGHFFGFGPSAAAGSVLAGGATLGDLSKRSLGADDQSAVCTVYPAAKPSPACDAGAPLPGPGCSCGAGSPRPTSGAAACWFALAGALLATGWFRRRGAAPPRA